MNLGIFYIASSTGGGKCVCGFDFQHRFQSDWFLLYQNIFKLYILRFCPEWSRKKKSFEIFQQFWYLDVVANENTSIYSQNHCI